MSNHQSFNRKNTILGMSILKFSIFSLTLLALALSVYLNFNFYKENNDLKYSLSETNIQIINQENAALRIENNQLKEENINLRIENNLLRSELEQSKLEYVKIYGNIQNHDFTHIILRTHSGNPIEIRFESLNGELIGRDDVINNYYEVELKNDETYVVKITYETRWRRSETFILDESFKFLSYQEREPKDW